MEEDLVQAALGSVSSLDVDIVLDHFDVKSKPPDDFGANVEVELVFNCASLLQLTSQALDKFISELGWSFVVGGSEEDVEKLMSLTSSIEEGLEDGMRFVTGLQFYTALPSSANLCKTLKFSAKESAVAATFVCSPFLLNWQQLLAASAGLKFVVTSLFKAKTTNIDWHQQLLLYLADKGKCKQLYTRINIDSCTQLGKCTAETLWMWIQCLKDGKWSCHDLNLENKVLLVPGRGCYIYIPVVQVASIALDRMRTNIFLIPLKFLVEDIPPLLQNIAQGDHVVGKGADVLDSEYVIVCKCFSDHHIDFFALQNRVDTFMSSLAADDEHWMMRLAMCRCCCYRQLQRGKHVMALVLKSWCNSNSDDGTREIVADMRTRCSDFDVP